MHISQLQSFLDAASCGSFNRAAREGHIAVQAFSQRIASLEQELGFALFDRTAKGVTLTPAGQEYAEAAREAVDALARGAARAQAAAQGGPAVIRVGVPWRVLPPLQRLCTAYGHEHPEATIEYVGSSHETVFRDLALGRCDVAFLPYRPDEPEAAVSGRLIGETSFVCAMRSDSPLAAQESVAPHDLVGRRVYAGVSEEAFRRMGLADEWPAGVDTVFDTDLPGDAPIMACLADPSCAVLFSSDTASLACPPLVSRPLKDAPPYLVGAYFRTDAPRAVGDFVTYVAERYE